MQRPPQEVVQQFLPSLEEARPAPSNSQANKLDLEDRSFHDWYRFVLSYPPRLVRDYVADFGLKQGQLLADPFCGTGTTLVEAKIQGIDSVGLEANPFAHFATTVKIDWTVDPGAMLRGAQETASETRKLLASQGLDDDNCPAVIPKRGILRKLEPSAERLLIKDSISPIPLHKVLVLLDQLEVQRAEPFFDHARLALANALVYSISNLRFGPEVGIGKVKRDTPVISPWLAQLGRIAQDLRLHAGGSSASSRVYLADARQIGRFIEPGSIDAVITSPPYPNEKDYTRTTRLESVLLGFVQSRDDLRAFKERLIRSNTRTVFKRDDDDLWVRNQPEIERIANEIETRRVAMGKTSGFERAYAKVTRLYFGGMTRHLADLRALLRPGARLAYVVGDQASYFRVMIRTGHLLADIAHSLGYEVERIDLFRTRFSTTTKEQLREEVVVLRWPA